MRYGNTATTDAIKEELGWLKVVFAVGAAIDASLIAWLAQAKADFGLFILAFVAAAVLTLYVARINTVAYRRIHELKDFQ